MTTRQALRDMIERTPDDARLEDEPLTGRELEALHHVARGESDGRSYTREEVERLLDEASG